MQSSADRLRDMFVHLVIVMAEKTCFDRGPVQTYTIAAFPLSLAHCDGTPMKTNKAALLNKLESLQCSALTGKTSLSAVPK